MDRHGQYVLEDLPAKLLGLLLWTLTLGHRGAETPKVRSLRGTEGAGDEGQGASQAAKALAVPIASHDPL